MASLLSSTTIADSPEWAALVAHADRIKSTHLRDLLSDSERCSAMMLSANDFLFDFSRQNATVETKELLLALARAAGVEEKKAKMFQGIKINSTEKRAVYHPALRAPKGDVMMVDGVDMVQEVHTVLDSIRDFSGKVRSGAWLGSTGKELTSVIAVGIGGSYLGPEFLYEALSTDSEAAAAAEGRTLRFLANVDPVDFKRATTGLDPETTLVVIVSKTFTTAETMLNARTIKSWLVEGIPSVSAEEVTRRHVIACSSALEKTAAFGIDPANVFGFWDWVGGRFSVHSAVGMCPLALHYGLPVLEGFLAGAHAMDVHFLNTPLEENMPVLLGLFGLWNSSFQGHATRAILPYSQALLRFPAHLQQLDMESNGKFVNLDGTFLPFQTGEIVFGEPGTNGQHSFYQLMHQGRVVPAEFIATCKSQNEIRLPGEEVSSHDELMCNFFAQPDALALGKSEQELVAEGVPPELVRHKYFPGNRPSMSMLLPDSSAYHLGQLLALYEHRVAVQGFVWGINSFDQWGVELGKALAKNVRKALVEGSTEGFNSSTTNLMAHYTANRSS
uniref:Glucose-6-phosphate isomerase n=1 Tax=Octactis speculum TaxID=3111310 RepID=A0A7S2D0L9_9STRA|mmetsp:Transcript_4216/g.4949  ORF Transcript_4216/g.4949 Transcript_4216/m.4949 type:complete len:559 (+) Transcript_4216:68-1744(+)